MSRSISNDSLSFEPEPSGSKRYVHLVSVPTSNANSRPGSATTTVGFVDHETTPRLFVPLKRAPTAGPVAPSSHTHLVVSGLHSPMRVTSLTTAYTTSGGASTETWTSAFVPFFMCPFLCVQDARRMAGTTTFGRLTTSASRSWS